jgi:hypothetical protein
VESYPQLQRYAWQMSYFKVAALVEKVESHCGNLFGMVGPGVWKASNNHVSIAYRFNLKQKN